MRKIEVTQNICLQNTQNEDKYNTKTDTGMQTAGVKIFWALENVWRHQLHPEGLGTGNQV
jgi:hypothetical protein